MKSRVLICAALFGVFAFAGANPSLSQKKDDPPKKAAEGDDLAKLRKAKLKAAEEAYRLCDDKWQRDIGNIAYLELCHLWSKRVVEMEVELASDKNFRIEPFTKHRSRMMAMEKYIKVQFPGNEDFKAHFAAIDYYVKDTELWLAQIKKDSK